MSVFSYVMDAVAELHSLLPDSILFGSLFLYFLTHHLAFGVFSLFLVEVVAAHRLTAWLFSQSVGPTKSSGPFRCRAGFKTIQYQYARIFTHESYPSYSLFSVSAIAAYLGLSTSAFAPTMKEMGADWTMRSMLAYLFIALFLFAFALTRLFTCEGATEVLIAVLVGILVGALSFSIHQALFGIESVNFLGLPYMIRKDKEGDAIYVCSRTGSV